MENVSELAEVIKYAIVGISSAAAVIGSVVGWARYSFLKRKVEVENENYTSRMQADVQKIQAETARMQDPTVRAYLARQRRIDFLREVLQKRDNYARDAFVDFSNHINVRENIDAVFGPCPNLEAELQRLEESAQNEPPFLGR